MITDMFRFSLSQSGYVIIPELSPGLQKDLQDGSTSEEETICYFGIPEFAPSPFLGGFAFSCCSTGCVHVFSFVL